MSSFEQGQDTTEPGWQELMADLPQVLAGVEGAENEEQERPAHNVYQVFIVKQPPEAKTEPFPMGEQNSESEQGDPMTETPFTRPQKKWHPLLLILTGIALAGMLGGSGYALVVFLLTPTATITVLPTARTVTTTTKVTIATGHVTSPQQQVPGRLLPSSITMSQEQSVATTGTGHQDAKAAHGLITFYNALPSVQVVAAGELLTGNDGIEVVTEQDAVIPAAVYPTFGAVSVRAHATLTGPAGNIQADDIYGPCTCRLTVSVASSAFTGGQDARSYPMVTPQDITGAAKTLKTSIDQSAQAALQTQVRTAWEHQAPALMDWTLTQLSSQEISEIPSWLPPMSSMNNQRELVQERPGCPACLRLWQALKHWCT